MAAQTTPAVFTNAGTKYLLTRHHPAAESLAHINRQHTPAITASHMLEALRDAVALDSKGEQALFGQAQVLDSMFHRLVMDAFDVKCLKGETIPGHIDPARLELALRTQKLCRNTLDSLNILRKTPPKRKRKK